VLASTNLAKVSQRCDVDREFGSSDHGPLVATFELPDESPA
jgi:exonuclease III